MKTSKTSFRFVAASMGITAPLWILSGVAHAQYTENFSNPSVANYWLEKTFNAGGTEAFNAFGAPTVSGGQLVGAVPTDTPTWAASYGGGQGFESVEHVGVSSVNSADPTGALAYYGGKLLGNLTANTGLTATFSLSDSAITPGAAFTASDFGGENTQGNQSIRLYIRDGNATDPGSPGYPLSEWWYNGSVALATSMSNGVPVTLTADLTNLSDWSGLDGDSASSESAAFETALGGVTELGLSFGSGTYFSDGFGFNVPESTASINLDSIATTVPEPASFSLLGIGALTLLRRRRRAQQ